MKEFDYVVLGSSTHFKCYPKTREVFCTHGDWGGKLRINEDGTCSVDRIKYSLYEFTEADSYDRAIELGVISS